MPSGIKELLDFGLRATKVLRGICCSHMQLKCPRSFANHQVVLGVPDKMQYTKNMNSLFAYPMRYTLGHTKKLSVVYLKFKFNW